MSIFSKTGDWLKNIGFNQYLPSSLKETLGIGSGIPISKENNTAMLQGIIRRMKPVAQTTSNAMSLGNYLQNQPSQGFSTAYPFSQADSIPPVNQPILNAMQDRITAGETPPAPTIPTIPKESDKTTSESPFLSPTADPAKTIYSQKITKKGVYMVRQDEFGNTTSTFLRENRPGDIAEGEIYTHQKEWRPLSTEYLQGKGQMYFAPPDILSRMQNRLT